MAGRLRLFAARPTLAKLGPNLLIVANQLFNSAANFAVTIALVRILGLAEFGHFSVYYVSILSVTAVIVGMFVHPSVSIAASASSEVKHELLSSGATLYLAAVVALALIAAGAGSLASLLGYPLPVWPAVALFTVIATNELARRLLLFTAAVRTAWLYDVVRFAGIACSLYFASGQAATGGAATAMSIVATAYAVALVALAVVLAPKRGMYSLDNFTSQAARIFRSGRWLSLSSILSLVQDNVFVFAGSAIAGLEAVGIVRTCQSITGLVNPLFFALDHILPRRIGQQISVFGEEEALRRYENLAWLACSVILALLGGLALLAGPLLGALVGTDAVGHAWVLQGLCLSILPSMAGVIISYPMRALERVRPIAIALFVSASISVVVAVPIISEFGIAGIVAGIALGNLTSLGMIIAGYRSMKHDAGRTMEQQQ